MIATAINLAPVLEVFATGNRGFSATGNGSGKYEWDYPEGNWSDDGNGEDSSIYNANHIGSLTYTEDGAYASTVATGGFIVPGESSHYRTDTNYRTRHVTVFNDCDAHLNEKAWNNTKNQYVWTPFYQIEYTRSNDNDTNPDTNRGSDFKTNEMTETALRAFKTVTGKTPSTKFWSNHTVHTGEFDSTVEEETTWAPWLIYGYGCSSEVQYREYDSKYTTWTKDEAKNKTVQSNYAKFYTTKPIKEGETKSDCDMRMTFRNFNNSDKAYFNPDFTTQSGGSRRYTNEGDVGINIGEYDYLEFDLMIYSDCEWKRSRKIIEDGKEKDNNTYKVYAHYETNCASGDYLDYANGMIVGWEHGSSFEDQLQWNSDGSYANPGDWVTIRIAIPQAVKDLKDSADPELRPTVKQFTIRMCGGNKGNKRAVAIDDIRLVKNDDHVGKVVTHDGQGNEVNAQYPSGQYFMVNDFEYNGEIDLTKKDVVKTNGVDMNYLCTTGASDIDIYPIYRMQEANVDDTMYLKKTAKNSWNAINWARTKKTTESNYDPHNVSAGSNGTVTQGDFGVNITARSGYVYDTSQFKKKDNTLDTVEKWLAPIYYRRLYTNSMDLSSFAYFSMDVFIRAQGSKGEDNNLGLPKMSGSSAEGVVFSVELQINNKDWVPVYFFLPYGKNCWAEQHLAPEKGNRAYGTILPLGKVGTAGTGSGELTHFYGDDTHTAHGATRFTFTRSDLLKAMSQKGITGDMNQVTGMQFIWCNQTSGDFYSYNPYTSVESTDIQYADVVLDNFITYTPDTSLTVKNQVTNNMDNGQKKDGSESDYLSDGQTFVYRLQGGYISGSTNGFTKTELGGEIDPITGKVDMTFTVPANGSVTIKNLPYNSYYLTQETWSWRYRAVSIAGRYHNYGTDDPNGTMDVRTINGNTAKIYPVVGGTKNIPIWEVMKKRNFTIYFDQTFVDRNYGVHPTTKPTKRENGYPNKQWLDGADTYTSVGN